MLRYSLLFIICLFSNAIIINAQSLRNVIINEEDNGKVLSRYLHSVEKDYDVNIVFNEIKIEALTINGVEKATRLLDYLGDYLIQYDVVKLNENLLFIVEKDISKNIGTNKSNYVVLGTTTNISGTVIDGSTDDPITGAQVTITGQSGGTLTDLNGRFSLKSTPRILRVEVNFIGYEETSIIVGFSDKVTTKELSTTIFPESQQLESVVISAERPDVNVKSQITGVEKMGIETIKTLPTFLGEVDPIRSLTTLPGVSVVGELSSGFNVRGGETGQNLILQDGATIYNPSHMFGFFSAFNPDMVHDVVLYKGGGPAKYGSRVSSILDVKLRNGDAGRFKLSGGVGLVSSRLTLEGPIAKGKTSYLVGGRVSYSNWLLKATDNIQLQNSRTNFHDVTAKIFHTINENNYLSLTFYESSDEFQLASDSTFNWQTINTSLQWDHTFSKSLSSSLTLANSNYESTVHNPDLIDGFDYSNSIKNGRMKYNMAFSKSENLTVETGVMAEYMLIDPGTLKVLNDDSNVLPADMNDQRGLESAVYAQADYVISPDLSLTAGLRLSMFHRLGEDNINEYNFNDIEGRYPVVVGTRDYSSGEVISSFSGLEPRLSLRYLLSETASLKGSYFRSYQYLHLISNTTATTPQDYWISSGPYLKPSMGDQFSLGLFKNLKNDVYEISAEGFYKKISNAVDYIEGADITLNPSLEAGLIQGEGKAYGLEFLLKKNQGKFNGWLSYTYSRSLRKFDTDSDRTTINNGDYYPAAYDQPHNLSLIFNWVISHRSTLSTNFSYSTGRPITIPISKFSYGPYLSVLNYSNRNEYRIPDYHRLDVSLTIKGDVKKNSRYRGEWVFSVYNLYGRKNAYSISFDSYGKASKLSILGSAFPSISYNFSF